MTVKWSRVRFDTYVLMLNGERSSGPRVLNSALPLSIPSNLSFESYNSPTTPTSSYVNVELLFEIIPKISIVPEGFEAVDKFVIFREVHKALPRGSCAVTNSDKNTHTDNTIAPDKIKAFTLYMT